MQNYYETMPYLIDRYKKISATLRFQGSSVADCQNWQQALRTELLHLTGMETMTACPLRPQIIETVALEGYARQKVILETEPGVLMPLYVLIPASLKPGTRQAAVIAPHGHVSGGKLAVAGIAASDELRQTIAQHNYDYGVALVRQGFVVFCPDARGFGERRETCSQGDAPAQVMRSSCEQLNHMALPLGQSVTGMWTWDLMRLVDYMQSRPEVNPDRIGCAGLSGGGLQTLWLAALDDRIKCAVISGYFYGYLQSLLVMSGNCSCNYVPHLWEKVDMGDIGALIAPRPVMIETGDQDPLNSPLKLENVYSQVRVMKKAYDVFSAADNLVHDVFPGEHRWHGELSVPFLKKWLMS
jgi:hypothetical protein